MIKPALSLSLLCAAMAAAALPAVAETVQVEMTVKEVDIAIDNAGNTRRMWTYDGAIPGPHDFGGPAGDPAEGKR